MRARRREINIFNMSLLDILCGALGAFCFMMLVALPYYIPPGSGLELRKAQAETDRLLLAIGVLKDQLPDQKSIDEMEKLLRQLEEQVKALQGRVNILTAKNEELKEKVDLLTAEKEEFRTQVTQLTADKEQLQGQVTQLTVDKQELQGANQQLQAKNKELTEANEKLTAAVRQRNPFVVSAQTTEFSQLIDLLVTNEIKRDAAAPGPHPGFNRWLTGEDPLQQIRAAFAGRASAFDLQLGGPVGNQFKVYLRLANSANLRQTTDINAALFEAMFHAPPTRLPKLTLSPERFWALWGTITIDENYRPIFKEATTEERDAEWAALINSTPPPVVTPTPRPTLSAEEEKAVREQRERQRALSQKFNRLQRLGNRPEEKDEAEVLALTEEFIKELPRGNFMRRDAERFRDRVLAERARRGARSPSPTASPTP